MVGGGSSTGLQAVCCRLANNEAVVQSGIWSVLDGHSNQKPSSVAAAAKQRNPAKLEML